jgi:hypothetical protein
MSEENKAEMVTKEQFEAQRAELEKLKKIFDERQTKVNEKADEKLKEAELTKEAVLKALGIEKDPEKDPMELINEKLSTTNKTVQELQDELKKEREAKEQFVKQTKVKDSIAKMNFVDPDIVMKLVDLDSETLEDDLKAIAESKPYLVRQDDKKLGGRFNGKSDNDPSEYNKIYENMQKMMKQRR